MLDFRKWDGPRCPMFKILIITQLGWDSTTRTTYNFLFVRPSKKPVFRSDKMECRTRLQLQPWLEIRGLCPAIFQRSTSSTPQCPQIGGEWCNTNALDPWSIEYRIISWVYSVLEKVIEYSGRHSETGKRYHQVATSLPCSNSPRLVPALPFSYALFAWLLSEAPAFFLALGLRVLSFRSNSWAEAK